MLPVPRRQFRVWMEMRNDATIRIDVDINNSSALSVYNRRNKNVQMCYLLWIGIRMYPWWKIARNWTQFGVDETKMRESLNPFFFAFALHVVIKRVPDPECANAILFSFISSLDSLSFDFLFLETEEMRTSRSIFYDEKCRREEAVLAA